MDINEWDEEEKHEEITVEELDAALKSYVDARNVYEDKQKIAASAHKEKEAREAALISLLERSGKKNWATDEGKISLVNKFSFTTPKDHEAKQAFAGWLEEKFGKDMFWDMFSVNSMSLNSFLKQEIEKNPLEKFPGIQEPIATVSTMFRRK